MGSSRKVGRAVLGRVLPILAACWLGTDASAQQRTVEIQALPPAVRAHVVSVDELPRFQTRTLGNAEIDVTSGIPRAVYRVAQSDPVRVAQVVPGSPEEAARSYIALAADQFKWNASNDALRVVHESTSPVSSHVLFQQVVEGVPVLYRYVKISLDDTGKPSFVTNGFDPRLNERFVAGNSISTTASDAKRTVAALFETPVDQVSEPTIAILPGETPRYVWRAIAHSVSAGGEWEFLVDAGTGALLSVRDRSLRRRELAVSGSSIARNRFSESEHVHTVGAARAGTSRATGSGHVFDPDPLATSGVNYGPPFVDAGDADGAELNGQRVPVTLQDIARGTDNLYRLEGPYVRIVGGGSQAYVPPAEAAADGFSFGRSDDRFEAVNAYYHVDKSQRYVQSLGFTDVRNGGVNINPLAMVADNSIYSPYSNLIEFGAGGVDDAEDAGVIWHEYAHALLEGSAPGLVDALEGQALHEGWADYWASSYLRSLADAGKTSRTDWQNVFRWDSGDGQLWPGRRVGVPGVYPDDFTCEDAGDTNGDGCNIYADGLIWASSLMEIFDEIGRQKTDQLNLQSHRYLSAPVTFRDAAEAILQADQDLFGGDNNTVLLAVLGSRGFVNASEFAPVAMHEPIGDTEDVSGERTIRVTAQSANASIDSVFVNYSINDGPVTRATLTHLAGDQYEGQIMLSGTPGVVEYYVEVLDTEGRRSVLPQSAPVTKFSFNVGPDNIAPTIDHEPIAVTSLIVWPLSINALVTDNLEVDTVRVDYELRNTDDVLVSSGTVGLVRGSSGEFEGPLDIDPNILEDDWRLDYAIVAIDKSIAANSTRSPASGWHRAVVKLTGTLLQYDFEGSAGRLTASGVWEQGEVESLLRIGHSGTQAWGTRINSSYPSTVTLSSLRLPTLAMQNVAEAYLVFWHWHDFEHFGNVEPGENNADATLVDGGNVKVSVGGGTYEVVEPLGGYSGILAGASGNPLAGQAGFGGYSFGWRREVVRLPVGDDIRVRFDFGTNDSNVASSLAYAGWFIDDVMIMTSVLADVAAPEFVSLPVPSTSVSSSTSAPPVVVRATDNTGIESVIMEIDAEHTTVDFADVRLAMSYDDAAEFTAPVMLTDPRPGDQIAYRIRIRDFDGNETIRPTLSEQPIEIVYKTIVQATALEAAVGTGYWAGDAGGWVAVSDGTSRQRSGLLLEPTTLSSNSDELFLDIRHAYQLGPGLGGNVKISADDGATWSILEPVGGYVGNFAAAAHPMGGELVFAGSLMSAETARFSLQEWAGEQVRLKMDLGSARQMNVGEFWSIESATIQTETKDVVLDTPLELSLNQNYPNPFSTSTTVSYTIPQESEVQLAVYDVLGRRVQVPVFERQPAGTHTVVIEGSNMASGIYFVRLIAEGAQRTATITVAH